MWGVPEHRPCLTSTLVEALPGGGMCGQSCSPQRPAPAGPEATAPYAGDLGPFSPRRPGLCSVTCALLVVLLRPALGRGHLGLGSGRGQVWCKGSSRVWTGPPAGSGGGDWCLGASEGKQAAWAGCVWVDLSGWAGTCPCGQGGASVLVRFKGSVELSELCPWGQSPCPWWR